MRLERNFSVPSCPFLAHSSMLQMPPPQAALGCAKAPAHQRGLGHTQGGNLDGSQAIFTYFYQGTAELAFTNNFLSQLARHEYFSLLRI